MFDYLINGLCGFAFFFARNLNVKQICGLIYWFSIQIMLSN